MSAEHLKELDELIAAGEIPDTYAFWVLGECVKGCKNNFELKILNVTGGVRVCAQADDYEVSSIWDCDDKSLNVAICKFAKLLFAP